MIEDLKDLGCVLKRFVDANSAVIEMIELFPERTNCYTFEKYDALHFSTAILAGMF